MDNDLWAKTSFRIFTERDLNEALVAELGAPARIARGNTWIWDVEKSSDQPLHDQLQELEDFLSNHIRFLRDIVEDSEVTIHLSWYLRVPQDGIGLSPRLTELLGEIRATIFLDTYIDEDSPRRYPLPFVTRQPESSHHPPAY